MCAQSGGRVMPPKEEFVKIGDLLAEFSEDADAAQAKYEKQRITVVGDVEEVSAPSGPSREVLCVVLQPEGGGKMSVRGDYTWDDLEGGMDIFLSKDGKEAVLRRRDHRGEVLDEQILYKVGAIAGLRGVVSEFSEDAIVLTSCQRVKREDWPEDISGQKEP